MENFVGFFTPASINVCHCRTCNYIILCQEINKIFQTYIIHCYCLADICVNVLFSNDVLTMKLVGVS